MSNTTPPDMEARMEAIKNAPKRVRHVAGYGMLLGLIVLLSFCASAFSGHVGWVKAILIGFFQMLVLVFAAASVQDWQKWGWWTLLALVVLRTFGGLGHSLRLLRLMLEGGLAEHGRDVLFDLVGVGQFVVCCMILWLLFTKEVREYIFKRQS
ncbi:MAG TPA: hypothetical protein VGH19_10410 [Verrucomicrobiae bacterium]